MSTGVAWPATEDAPPEPTSSPLRSTALDVLCRVPPRALVRWTGRAARTIAPFRTRALRRNLAELFRETSPAPRYELAALAREIYVRDRMDQMLVAYTRRRGRPLGVGLVDHGCLPAFEVLRAGNAPTLAVTWHVGPTFGLSIICAELGIRPLGVLRDPATEPNADRRLYTTGHPNAQADVLWQALRELKDGGSVLMAIDVPDTPQAPRQRRLGHSIPFARGPLTLARLSGVRVVPVVPQWSDDGRLTACVGEPFDTAGVSRGDAAAFEGALVEQIADWFERYVLAHPDAFRERWLRLLLRRSAQAPRL